MTPVMGGKVTFIGDRESVVADITPVGSDLVDRALGEARSVLVAACHGGLLEI
jgi:hypothetical protein